MRTSLHVLLVGPDADAIGEATLALAGAGHTVSHVTAESGVPFRWPTGDRHSFDPDTVDVVVSIPGHALVGVPWCEERVLTLTESGVPLVLAGTPLASPYTAWATSYTSPGADLVLVVEDAVRQRAAQADVLPEHDHDDHVSRTVFDPIDFEQSGGEPLTRARFQPRGGTPLLDATAHLVARARAKVGDGPWFTFANTHLEAFDDRTVVPSIRALQAKEFAKAMSKVKGPLIALGDFNSDSPGLVPGDEQAFEALTKAGFRDIGTTTPLSCCIADSYDLKTGGSINDFDHRVDQIFTTTPKKVKRIKTWVVGREQSFGYWHSDHAGVVGKYALK